MFYFENLLPTFSFYPHLMVSTYTSWYQSPPTGDQSRSSTSLTYPEPAAGGRRASCPRYSWQTYPARSSNLLSNTKSVGPDSMSDLPYTIWALNLQEFSCSLSRSQDLDRRG
jgi:hypothetical protein